MSAKKKKQKRTKPGPKPFGRGERERMFADMYRAMDQTVFESAKDTQQFIDDYNAGRIKPPEKTPQHQAQDLVYDAWDEADAKRRVELARQALELWPKCADAYEVLADEAPDLAQSRALLEKGVEVAREELGPEPFEEDVGKFWGVYSTRPYMRVRSALAQCLWASGDRELAVRHLKEMLRLNPDDNQALRYLLIGWYAELGDDAGMARLLVRYDEPDTVMSWARALLQFRNWGDSDQSRSALVDAMKANPEVLIIMLNPGKMPAHRGWTVSPGSKEEAAEVVLNLGRAWLQTPGAVEWLVQTIKDLGRRQKSRDRTKQP
jgi:tetratricopeptide (TPR) repeat protein